MSLLLYNNRGTVENFVVYAKASLYTSYYSSYLIRENRGTVQNGYIYGEALEAAYTTNQSSKYIGSMIVYNIDGMLENVYSLVDVNTIKSGKEVDKQVGNLVGRNIGTVQNSYSVGSGENRDLSLDANMGVIGGSTTNLYYVASDLYAGDASTKISPMALWNADFQNGVINQDQAFIIDEYVSEEELTMVRNYMLGDMCRSYESAFSLADAWIYLESEELDQDFYSRSVEAVKAVTPDELQELAQKYFCKENLIEVVAGKKV